MCLRPQRSVETRCPVDIRFAPTEVKRRSQRLVDADWQRPERRSRIFECWQHSKKGHPSDVLYIKESARRDSNPRPRPWQGRAPPTEPLAHMLSEIRLIKYRIVRARDGTRTRDPDLGKVVLHQLSHSRILLSVVSDTFDIILCPKQFVNNFFKI